MLSEHVAGVLDHKKQVSGYMRIATNELFRRAVEFGEVIPFHLETDDHITLMDVIDVTCKLKRDGYSKFQLSRQLDGIVKNTIEYLADSEETAVCGWIGYIIQDLFQRAIVHDDSKFSPEELEAFEEATPNLKNLTYGSEEYRAELRKIKPAIQHHYQQNRHHPEYFEFEADGIHGIDGMNLVDLIEMVCDWIAAVKRVKDGDIYKSLPINQERFHIDKQLYGIIQNTVDALLAGK